MPQRAPAQHHRQSFWHARGMSATLASQRGNRLAAEERPLEAATEAAATAGLSSNGSVGGDATVSPAAEPAAPSSVAAPISAAGGVEADQGAQQQQQQQPLPPPPPLLAALRADADPWLDPAPDSGSLAEAAALSCLPAAASGAAQCPHAAAAAGKVALASSDSSSALDMSAAEQADRRWACRVCGQDTMTEEAAFHHFKVMGLMTVK